MEQYLSSLTSRSHYKCFLPLVLEGEAENVRMGLSEILRSHGAQLLIPLSDSVDQYVVHTNLLDLKK